MPCNEKPETCGWSGTKTGSGSSCSDPICPKKEEYGGCCGSPFSAASTYSRPSTTVTLAECGRYVLYGSTGNGFVTDAAIALGTNFEFVVPRTSECGIVLDGVNLTNNLVKMVEGSIALTAVFPPATPAGYPNVNYITPQYLGAAGVVTPAAVVSGLVVAGKAPNLYLSIINSSKATVYFVASKECDKESIECAARSIGARPNETIRLMFDVVTRQWLVTDHS